MSSTIDLTSIYTTNLLGCLMMLVLLICKGWKIHSRKLTSTILLIMILSALTGCILDPIVFYADGKPGEFNYFIVYAGNFILYLLNIIVGPSFVTIVYNYINERISKLHINIIYILCTFETLLLFINLIVPIVFSVDDNNVYCRHAFYWVYAFAEVLLICDGLVIYFNAVRKGRARQYYPMWVFIVPLAVGSLIQSFSYGVSLLWPCVGISVCSIVVSLKNEGIITDNLTGVFNRAYLDSVKATLRKSHSGNFSALMLDIDGFKQINEKYGHSEGDEVLIEFADILTDTVRSSAAVIRIVGDRFFILLDSFSDDVLSDCRLAVMNAIEEYNRTSDKPYSISVSIGSNNFNLKECDINELLDSFDKIMTAVKYGYESPVLKELEENNLYPGVVI